MIQPLDRRSTFKVDWHSWASGPQSLVGADGTLCDGALIEALLACSTEDSLSLHNIVFGCRALPIEQRTTFIVADYDAKRYELISRANEGASGVPYLHVFASTASSSTHQIRRPDLDAARGAPLDASRLDQLFKLSVAATPAHPVVREAWLGMRTASATFEATFVSEAVREGFILHPLMIQHALDLARALLSQRGQDSVQLSRVGEVSIDAARRNQIALVACNQCAGNSALFDLDFADRDGHSIAHFGGVLFQSRIAHVAEHERWLGEEVAAIVRGALSLPAVARDESLVAAGASSLDLVRILGAIVERWGWAPAIEVVLQAPTSANIARCLLSDSETDSISDFTTIVGDEQDALSFAEHRLWFLEQSASGLPAYNETICWILEGPLECAALEAALREIVADWDVLRSVFPMSNGAPHRVVQRDVHMQLECYRRDSDSSAAALAGEVIGRRFNLQEGPLLRAALVELPASRHVFVVVAHHIALDAWSASEIMLPELGRLYAQAMRGTPFEKRPHATMARFAAWERERERRGAFDSGLDWWSHALEGVPTNLELTTDYPRPARRTHAGKRYAVALGAGLADALRDRARECSVTMFVLVLAAYQILLFRQTLQKRFLIAVPVSLRRNSDDTSQFGCMVNTLPMRAELHGRSTLRDVVKATQAFVLAALARRDVPFDLIVRRVCRERNLTDNPLTQVAFSYAEEPLHTLQLKGCVARPFDIDPGTSKFDLMLEVHDRHTDLELTFEYSTELFAQARVEQLADYFLGVLQRLAMEPNAILGDPQLLTSPRKRWPPRDAAFIGLDVPALIDRNLERGNPDVAVVAGDLRLSYASLRERVIEIEAHVRAHSAPGERLVAICAERSVDWVAALVAVLRAGLAYLPIDARVPKQRALGLLKEASVRRLYYQRRCCSWFAEFDGEATELCSTADGRHSTDKDRLRVPTLYAIATSGSSGKPKLAAVSRAGFWNLVSWYVGLLEANHDARFLVMSAVGFDLTQKNVFAALCVGARLVLVENSTFEPREVLEVIRREQITIINCTPTQFYPLVELASGSNYLALCSVEWVVLGGEPIDGARILDWMRHSSCRARFVDSYGPTECTDVVAFTEFALENDFARSSIAIGRAIPNVTLEVLDDSFHPVDDGCKGNLFVKGVAVGEGYIGHDDSKRFSRDGSGALRYDTGDMVYRRWDGRLVYVGRVDDEVKVRGHRISLGEIEAAMRHCEGVRDAAVAVQRDQTGTSVLYGYFVARDGQSLETSVLRRSLGESLPSYMIPSFLCQLAAIPLTDSGKVDRTSLPPMPEALSNRGATCRSDLDRSLMEIWSELLGRSGFGIDDSFFELGGHSLLAVKLAESIQSELGYACSVTDVFVNPTIRLLGESLESPSHERGYESAPAQPKPGA